MEYDFIVSVAVIVLLFSRFSLKAKLKALKKNYATIESENAELIKKINTPVEQINEAKKDFESIVCKPVKKQKLSVVLKKKTTKKHDK